VLTLFPLLAERRTQLAGRLSGGERQMCAVEKQRHDGAACC
jgi:ABC-type branched-subunit amino acid transport system ATPase component